jgi:hypothetical protein
VRKLIVLILFLSGASTASANCQQDDLSDRWEFFSRGKFCQFYLDSEGELYKASCDQLFDSLADQYHISASGRISVNRFCRVSGTIVVDVFDERGAPLLEESLMWTLVGRANSDKTLIEGETKSNFFGYISFCSEPDDLNCYNHFSMVKY